MILQSSNSGTRYTPLPPGLVQRGLTLEQAAALAGLSKSGYKKARKMGDYPGPTLPGKRYDRCLLEDAMDRLSKIRKARGLFPARRLEGEPCASQFAELTPSTRHSRMERGGPTTIIAQPANVSTVCQIRPSSSPATVTPKKQYFDSPNGNFSSLVRGYTLSVEFTERLAASTQAEYRRMLTAAEAEFGNMPLAALDDPRVRKDFLDWREKVARTSGEREADNRLSAISAMLTWAVDRGQATANHLARLQTSLPRRSVRDHLAARAHRCLHEGGTDRDAASADPRAAHRPARGRSPADDVVGL